MLPSESSLPIARRATWRDTECLELVCGIANAGGGRLILDADVDSRGAVKRRTSRLMKTIPGLIGQSLNLTCAVELVLDSGRFCLEVVIPPANDPISFRGIFFFYKDGENHILDDEALDRLMQRDMEADVKWEQRPVVQASLDDLNMGLVTRFTGAARDTDLTVDLDEVSAIEQTLRPCGPHDRRRHPHQCGHPFAAQSATPVHPRRHGAHRVFWKSRRYAHLRGRGLRFPHRASALNRRAAL